LCWDDASCSNGCPATGGDFLEPGGDRHERVQNFRVGKRQEKRAYDKTDESGYESMDQRTMRGVRRRSDPL
jgi:hypothetical protein